MKGGFINSPLGKMAGRAASMAGSSAVNRYRSNPKYRKYFSTIDAIAGKPIEKMLFDAFAKHATGSGLVIPKLGVLTSPLIKSRYLKVKGRGTGITRSIYTSGRAMPIPKTLYKTAYRQIFVKSDQEANFSVPVTGVTSTSTHGVAEYGFLRVGELKTLIKEFPDGVYSKSALGSFYFSNVKSVLSITSATNINCSVRVYECTAKRDTSVSQYVTPEESWSSGLYATTGRAQRDAYTNLGMYPGNSEFFRNYWHVENYIDIDMQSGSSHVHTSTYNINSSFPNCLFHYQRDPKATIAGLTRYYLIVLTGTPVHDADNPSLVGMGSAKVDVNVTQTFEYYANPFTDEGLAFNVASDDIGTQDVVTETTIKETEVMPKAEPSPQPPTNLD